MVRGVSVELHMFFCTVDNVLVSNPLQALLKPFSFRLEKGDIFVLRLHELLVFDQELFVIGKGRKAWQLLTYKEVPRQCDRPVAKNPGM